MSTELITQIQNLNASTVATIGWIIAVSAVTYILRNISQTVREHVMEAREIKETTIEIAANTAASTQALNEKIGALQSQFGRIADEIRILAHDHSEKHSHLAERVARLEARSDRLN